MGWIILILLGIEARRPRAANASRGPEAEARE
jgi:hypothetical protein